MNLIFVRHCESTWNEVFNKGPILERLLLMPFRIIKALINEAIETPSGGSIFLDSPLSADGLTQVSEALSSFLKEIRLDIRFCTTDHVIMHFHGKCASTLSLEAADVKACRQGCYLLLWRVAK